MSQAIQLAAEVRERAGKGAARATRRSGRVPAVIYGAKLDPVMISLDPIELTKQMNRAGFFTHVFEIEVGGAKHQCLARDLQLDPVTDRALHVDFMRFQADTTINVDVAVEFVNDLKSPGIKRGGVLNIVRHDIELICSPTNIPEVITIDLTGLEIGDSVHISAVNLPEGVTPTITDRDFTIATIAAPSAMKAEPVEGEEEEEAEE
ncbi:MAG: 50S ribosomal protein L25/general stress protein Ctc [Rhodospirillales bacterium]